MFDPDEAGNKAAKRAKKPLKQKNIYGGTLRLPKGLDPADFITKYGRSGLNTKVRIIK
jgi:DNA primase